MRKIYLYAVLTVAAWATVVAWSCYTNLQQHDQTILELATIQARTAYKKDLAYRQWNSESGGVYVPISKHIPPNPYLAHLPDRDIRTEDGRQLTLVNPAYMSRLVFDAEREGYGARSHLTSLNPIRKENAPDIWEASALGAFERGEREAIQVYEIDGRPYLRLMRPFHVEIECLRCHEQQGYHVGDVRGGISIAVPLMEISEAIGAQKAKIWLSHGLIFTIGLLFIYIKTNETIKSAELIIKSEREARRAARAAWEASSAKSSFLANMSHEIRTPMNSIIGMTSAAMELSHSEEQLEYLRIVAHSAESLMVLINDILDLTKIEHGKLTLEHVVFDLHRQIIDTLNMFRVLVEEKGVALNCCFAHDVPRYMKGDPMRLRQVITNLIGNAVKFTQRGGVALSIERSSRDAGPGKICLLFTVDDTGIGIPQDKLEHIFESFSQADAATTREYGGTGLGLTISRKLVHLFGGSINVESEPGGGSSFSFEAVFETADCDELIVGSPMKITSEHIVPARVLLVEDNIINQKIAVRILNKHGHEVTVADSGLEAIEALKESEFDVVLMDVQMPIMDGYETTAHLRALKGAATSSQVPVIAMTAHAMSGDRERCLQAGMDDYISKPIDARLLISTIQRNLKKDA